MEKGAGEEPARGGGVGERSGRRLSNPKRGPRERDLSSFFPRRGVTFWVFKKKKKEVAATTGVERVQGRAGTTAEMTIQSQDTAEDCTAASGQRCVGRRGCAADRSQMSGSRGRQPTLKTPAAGRGRAQGARAQGAGAGVRRQAPPPPTPPAARRAPGQPTASRPMGRRGRSLCPDPGPPPAPALCSAAARPPRLLPQQFQKLFMRSAGWLVVRWDSAPGKRDLSGANRQREVGLRECRGQQECPFAAVRFHLLRTSGSRARPRAPRVPRSATPRTAAPQCRCSVPRSAAWPPGPLGDNSEGPAAALRTEALRFSRQSAADFAV